MDFDLDDDQRLLRDSVDRLIADTCGFEQRRASAAEPDGWSRDTWRAFADLGLLGLPFDEADGGFGGGPVSTMLVMEAIGRGLVLEPYLPVVVLAGGVIRAAASGTQRTALVPEIASGRAIPAFAHLEATSRYDLADVATTARADGDAWRIDGQKGLVLAGACATHLVVTARTGGGRRERDGVGLFLVSASDPGVARRAYPTQDGARAAEITFSGARGEPLGDPAGGLPAAERAVDQTIAALCAEAVGVMERMHALTLDYLKTRKQFGRAIGDFQVLQHRAVDMLVSLEQARGMAVYATAMADEPDPAERRRAMSAAKIQIGRSGRHIGQEAIQLHGGIGMTMEYAVGHYFKRMTMIDMLFGDADAHLTELAASGGLYRSRAA